MRFYKDGWKTGFLESSNGFQAVVVPIGPKGKKMRKVTLPADDVEEIKQ